MGPLVRRSWQPRGRAPVLVQRGRRLEKVSALAALCVSPRRNRVRLYFRLHPQAEIRTRQVVGFLGHLNAELKGPCVLLWDRLNAHPPNARDTLWKVPIICIHSSCPLTRLNSTRSSTSGPI
jgi:hypothetical protein